MAGAIDIAIRIPSGLAVMREGYVKKTVAENPQTNQYSHIEPNVFATVRWPSGNHRAASFVGKNMMNG